jgi:HSP20 family protein
MTTAVSERKTAGRAETAVTREAETSLGFPSLNRLRQEFDGLWNKFFTEMPALWSAERADHRWGFDVEDQPDAYVIKAEAPGFSPQDFQLELRGEQLVLQAKKSEKKKGKDEESFTATEFYHAMTIPPYVDTDKIDASYKQGVLTVSLPKTPEAQGRKIPVKG